MIRVLLGLVLSLVGMSAGFGVFKLMEIGGLFEGLVGWKYIAVIVSICGLFGFIFFILYNKISYLVKKIISAIEQELEKYSYQDLLFSSIGLIIGLIIAFFISKPFLSIEIPVVGEVVTFLIYLVLAYIGINLPYNRRGEIKEALDSTKTQFFSRDKSKSKKSSNPKILDTSAIIDGRIKDICMTGFVEGPLIIPEFVLKELQHIADSSDSLKRTKGRRGLDIVKIMQEELPIEVKINETAIDDAEEVDMKVIKLARSLGGSVVTTDYNLNKVADVKGIQVLNINELANSIKTLLLPGENLTVQVIKDGKEANQGIAYLDDGTMIVVENGKRHMGDNIETLVTSVIQTPAGRMIFVRPV
ncbi:MAG: PIN domain nuclease [Tissierellia bacterium]|nr:PIN domain nuclease [Tissierellia bacterium]